MGEVKDILQHLPPLIGRSEVHKFFPGILTPKTLANLASQGLGPPYFKIGRKIVYRTEDLLDWLQSRAVEVRTVRR